MYQNTTQACACSPAYPTHSYSRFVLMYVVIRLLLEMRKMCCRLIINYNNLPDDEIWAVWCTLDKIQFSQLLKLSFIVSKSYIFSLHKRRILEFCNGMMFLTWSEVNMNCNDISKSTYFQKRTNRSSARIHIQKSIFSKHWLLDQFSFSISFLRIFCNPWLRKIILTSLWFIFSFSLQ